jgi:hypothetical protein
VAIGLAGVLDVEDRRRKEPAVAEPVRAPAAHDEPGAAGALARVDMGGDAAVLDLRDERTDVVVVDARTDAHGAEVLYERLDDVRVQRTVDEDPALRVARLPGVPEHGGAQRRHERGHVDVAEDDARRLAAELEHHGAHLPRAGGHHPLARGARAGERDVVDVRVVGERGACFGAEAR